MVAAASAPLVLAVEDDDGLAALYRDLLEPEGYRVEVCHDAPPATEVVSLAPAAVLLDFFVGGDDRGWRLLQDLKTEPATRAIPVLIVSAARDRIAAAAGQLAAWDCEVVAKPFDIDVLLAALRQRVSEPAAARSTSPD